MSIGPFIKIKNNQGFELRLESFTMFYTYEGYIQWSPPGLPEAYNYEQNKIALKSLYENLQNKRPNYGVFHFKAPTEEELKQHMLGAMCFMCHLIANKPINEGSENSALTYAWLGDVPFGKTIEEIIVLELQTLDWSLLGRDFDY